MLDCTNSKERPRVHVAASRQLIVNADDFGYTVGVNRGIIEAHRQGILTSATIMANGDAFDDAVSRSRENPDLGVGVHLNVVEGTPLSDPHDVMSLTGKGGRFHSKAKLVVCHLTGRIRLSELKREIAAQVDRVIGAGVPPTHLDSHQHIHAYPPFMEVFVDVAQSRGIRAIRLPAERPRFGQLMKSPTAASRVAAILTMCSLSRHKILCSKLRTSDAFAGVLKTGSMSSSCLLEILKSLRAGVTELMTHPGYCDDALAVAPTRLTAARETELRALTDPDVLEFVHTAEMELIHFGALNDTAPPPSI